MKIVLSDILKGKKRIALSGHVRPDGDCVGSSMGLYLYLTEQFPEIEVDLYLEKIPASFSIISRTEEIRHTLSEETAYDLFICLDCGDEQRLGPFAPLLRQAAHTVCIDHHVSNDAFAELNYIRPEASSTSELVYTLLEDEKISKACAEALYMGIAHDTGVFQYSCTSPETMEAAAQLLRKGIDGSEIIEKTYFEKTYIQNQILGRALLESMLVLEKQVVVSVVSRKEMKFFEAVPSDLEGIVAQLRQTKGVEVAIFLHETDTREYKVSLRSKGKVNVSSIAQYFGGGGHVRAAGVTMKGSAHDVINNLLRQIDTDIFANITLHNTCYNVFLFFKILIVYYFSFFLADLLKNQVFRIHCCNTSKLFGLYRNLTNISDLQCGINLFRIFQCDLDCRIKHFLNYFFFCVNSIITGLSVHDHLDIIRCPEVVFAGTDERVFNRIHHGISADVLLFFKNCQSFH